MSFVRTFSIHNLLLASALMLAACGVTPDYTPKVDRTTASHTILFAPGEDALNAAESEALGNFLSTLSPMSVKDISLNIGVSNELTDTRIGAVTSELQMYGFPGKKVVLFIGEEEPDADAMRMDITYAVAIPNARCPNWNRPGANYLNAPHSNFGCAYNNNLAAMIADPEDLERGHGNNAVSADRNALVLQRYRQGVDIAPPAAAAATTAPTSTSGGGGESGGGETPQ